MSILDIVKCCKQYKMEKLLEISHRRMSNTRLDFMRDMYEHIEWKSRLILLKGSRGVGKTYMMLQHIKKCGKKSIYISMDNLYFVTDTMTETIDELYKNGYRIFGLDEVHKYPNWSIELKNIYDNYHDIQLIVTSSSALNILAGQGDLSRRLDEYTMKGLTFTEYLRFEHSEVLPSYTWDELKEEHISLHDTYYEAYSLNKKFNTYLRTGYYPYYKEAGKKYHDRLLAVILQVIDSDMLALFNIDYEATRQIKKLLALIARIGPFSPNITKLSRDLVMSRNSILTYFDYLKEADIINALKSAHKSDSAMTKPDKIYFENTNLLFAFDADTVNTGTLRETFVMNALNNIAHVTTPLKGDFLVNTEDVVEVGGKNKNFHQLAGMPNPILIKEGIEKGGKGIIPMWALGFLKQRTQ